MKRLAVIFIIPLVLLQSCAGIFMMTAFYANRSYIANNLCENRNTSMAPMCGGTCVLMGKLKKEKEREDKNPELKFKDFQLLSGLTDFRMLKQLVLAIKTAVLFNGGNLLYHAPSLGAVFHPPLA